MMDLLERSFHTTQVLIIVGTDSSENIQRYGHEQLVCVTALFD